MINHSVGGKTNKRDERITPQSHLSFQISACSVFDFHKYRSCSSVSLNSRVDGVSSLKMTDPLSSKALQVILIGEHLRNRLHAEHDRAMIRDRRYHLRMYSCCFVGRDLVDWLIKNGDANSRGGAIQCMNILLENRIIHHGK